MQYSTTHMTPLGMVTLAANDDGQDDGAHIVGLWFNEQKYYGATITGSLTQKDDLALFATAKDWLDRYFAGDRPSVSELPLAPLGNEFRTHVWNILREIPYGELTTYGEIAKTVAAQMGKARMSSQAVGGAVGHNPISILIPCHRVVGSQGSLTGYAGGIERKRRLLELEGVDMTRLSIPTESISN